MQRHNRDRSTVSVPTRKVLCVDLLHVRNALQGNTVLYLVSVKIAKLAGTLEPTVYFHAVQRRAVFVIPRVRCEDNEFVGRKPNILTVLSKKSNELYIAWRLPYANSTLLRVVVRLKNFGDSSSVDNIDYIVDPSGTSATIQTPEPVSRKVYKIDIQILYENQLVSPTATYSTACTTRFSVDSFT